MTRAYLVKTALSSVFSKLIKLPRSQLLLMMLAVSLPFDRFPTHSVLGIDVKLSSVVGLVCIFMALYLLVTKKRPLPLLLYFLPIILWAGWLLVGLSGVSNVRDGLQTTLPLLFLISLSGSVAVLWQRSYTRTVLCALFAGTVFTLIFGMFQFIGNFAGLSNAVTLIRPEYSWQGFGFPRIHSFSVEPLYFASFLLLPIGLLGAGIIKNQAFRKWLLYGVFLVSCSVVVLTLSRGGILGLLIVFAVLATLYARTLVKLVSLRLVAGVFIGFIASIVLVFGTIALFNKPGNDTDLTYGKRGISTFVSHLTNTRFFANKDNKAKDDSIGQRDSARTQAVDILKTDKKAFWLGIGPGQYSKYATEKYGTLYAGDANNMVLEQWIQGGVVGIMLLAIFFGFILRGLYSAARRESWIAAGLLAYLLAVLVQAQTFHGLALTHLWFALGLAAAQITLSNRSGSLTANAMRRRTSD